MSRFAAFFVVAVLIQVACGLADVRAEDVRKVRVAVCQTRVEDGDIAGNMARVEEFVERAANEGAEICVLPELVDVGFGAIVQSDRGKGLAKPVPGATSDRLGQIAKRHRVWLAAAILEEVPGGAYDTNVLISDRGRVVLKSRKAFVYPSFGGVPAFSGNYHDAILAESPWGPIGLMNCADTQTPAKRTVFQDDNPSLMLVSFANPGANLLKNCRDLATECACPVVGVNMVFGDSREAGGSRVYSASGDLLWKGPSQKEIMEVIGVPIAPLANRPPQVDAGDVQTIRQPTNEIALSGYVSDDGELRVSWSKVKGPGRVSFADAQAPQTTATLGEPGVYTLRLTADDAEDARSDDVMVNVLPAGSGDVRVAGHWAFDGNTDDLSGLGHHGILEGDARFSSDTAPIGLENRGSLELDGKGDFVRVAHRPALDAEAAATVSMWIKPRSYPGFWPAGNDWASLLNKGEDWGDSNYQLGFGAYFHLHSDSMGMRIPSLGDAMRTPNLWHHVAVVVDGVKGQGRIYVNGVLDHVVVNRPRTTTNPSPLYIGVHHPGVTSIDGKIDEVRLWTRALSDQEIANLVPHGGVNRRPEISAGRDLTAFAGKAVTLEGSYLDDGNPMTSHTGQWTRWRRVSGPAAVEIDDHFAVSATATFPLAGRYVLELSGSDGAHRVRDTVTVRVRNEQETR